MASVYSTWSEHVGPGEPGQVGGEFGECEYAVGRTKPGRVRVVPALMLDTYRKKYTYIVQSYWLKVSAKHCCCGQVLLLLGMQNYT